MGFNLKVFFEGLEEIINSDEENISLILADLIQRIEEGKKYAEQCGQL